MIKYKKMNFIDELKEYLRSKTKEEVLNDWEESRIESGVQFAEQVINKSESISGVSDTVCEHCGIPLKPSKLNVCSDCVQTLAS
jgi:predicted Zn-ribbon and HTH transcriptional regulator